MRKKRPLNWTPEMDAELIRMNTQLVMTQKEMADKLMEQFGVPFTRKMVYAHLYRLRQSKDNGISTGAKPRPHGATRKGLLTRALTATSGGSPKLVAARDKQASLPAPVAKAELYYDPFAPDKSKAHGKRLTDLKAGQCRWEVTGREHPQQYRFCGEAVAESHPFAYCTLHMLRSRKKPLTFEDMKK